MIKFKESLPQRLKYVLDNQKNVQLLPRTSKQEFVWDLMPSTYRSDNTCWWGQLLQFVQQTNVSKITICGDQWVLGNVLLNLQYTKFTHLTLIHIDMCNIDSIEALAHLDCPIVKFIQISNGHIRCTKALNKLKFNRLKQLDFTATSIQLSGLNRIKVAIQDRNYGSLSILRKNIYHNISMLSKIEGIKSIEQIDLKRLFLNQKVFIPKKVKQYIRRKFANEKILFRLKETN